MNNIIVANRQRDVDHVRCMLSRWMASSLHSKSNLGDAGLLFFVKEIIDSAAMGNRRHCNLLGRVAQQEGKVAQPVCADDERHMKIADSISLGRLFEVNLRIVSI